ncbi:MAG: hypothetical protein WCT30_07665, partial [Desulfurivibrionaceae bacterium]
FLTFFQGIGVPGTEFIPATQIVIARGAIILMNLAYDNFIWVLLVPLSLFLLRLIKDRDAIGGQLVQRAINVLALFAGFPTALFAVFFYVCFVYHAVETGHTEAIQRTWGGAVRLRVYCKSEILGRPGPIEGWLIAESPASYAIADKSLKRVPIIVPKSEVIWMDGY